jgi:hypothetical protein
MPAFRVIAVPPAVQQHQPGTVTVHLQKRVQPANFPNRLLNRVKLLDFQGVDRGSQIIPMGIEGIFQIYAHLGRNFVQLHGPFLKNLPL